VPDLPTAWRIQGRQVDVLGALGTQVLVQTLFFAAACGLMMVLNLGGRPVWAALVPAALIGGVLVLAGPLAVLPGTLAGPPTPDQIPGLSSVPFAVPLWWRLIVAAAAAVPFAGAWFLTRRPGQRQPLAPGQTLGALGLFGLVVEIAVLASPGLLIPDHATVPEAMPTALVLLVVGGCAAVAGCTGPGRRGAVTALTLLLVGAAVWSAAWLLYRRGDTQQIFGWEQVGADPLLWLGTQQLIAIVLAAGGLGWVTSAVTQRLTERRAGGRKPFGDQTVRPLRLKRFRTSL
jgi:hypothetical protein